MKKMKMTSGIKALAEDLRFRGELPPSPRELLKDLRKQGELPPPSSTVRTEKADDPVAITMQEYGALEEAFKFLNTKLFDGRLPDAMFNYTRKPHMLGHFAPDRYSGRVAQFKKPEIALNPDSFIGRTDEQIVSTLGHEMVHLEQETFGKPGSRGYHNKEWAARMESIGLMPSNTGAVGGRRTGQQMSHFILPNGAFAKAFAELAATGWELKLQSTIYAGGEKKPKKDKTKYTCPSCGLNMWANIPGADISCNSCQCVMPAERPAPAVASYEQAAE